GSGSGFSVGPTSVTCTAKDAANNVGSCSFTVAVRDTTPPAILCPADITAECVSSGAAVTPGTATGSDTCGSVTLTSYPARTFPFGDTPLTYTATDGAGLTTSCTSTIHVVDTTPPTIQCPAPATIECTSKRSAPFAPAAATASDTCAGVSMQHPAAGTFPLGTTTLNYAVTDAVGLKASCQSSVQ